MARSFGLVEEKLCEADFFLDQLRRSRRESFYARCYFSAFVSAARSVTWVLQAGMSGVTGFETWYGLAQAKLKSDPLAPFFVEIRNRSEKTGENPLNRVTLAHLREDLSHQLRGRKRSHVLVIPSFGGATLLTYAVQACTLYFTSLVEVIFECYADFKRVVDPQWYFTQENFIRMGKTLEDAVRELGLPPVWASCAPKDEGAWRALRSQQPACEINHLFRQYLGREIVGPDDVSGGS
jgi:hypothetical protein